MYSSCIPNCPGSGEDSRAGDAPTEIFSARSRAQKKAACGAAPTVQGSGRKLPRRRVELTGG